MVEEIDVDGSGSIDFDEFRLMMVKQLEVSFIGHHKNFVILTRGIFEKIDLYLPFGTTSF